MRAIALFSGGLDSMLAIKMIKNQGIDVTAIHLNIGFGGREDTTELKRKRATMAGADFEVIDIQEQFIQDVLFSPKYGYGKHFNPCIDCHANMIKVAKVMMKKLDAQFIITGEVVGQRPMSQRAEAIKQVTELANEDMDDAIVLRPLCAHHMPETKVEKEGLVDRSKLMGITGRSREEQLKLAEEFGFDDFESPGGGCLLTDANYAKKIKDFVKYEKFEVEDISVLKVGRHFRLPGGAKLVIGRNKEDNAKIEEIDNSKMFKAQAEGINGPLSLLSSNATDEDKKLAAVLITTYARSEKETEYDVSVGEEMIKATPLDSKSDAHQYFL